MAKDKITEYDATAANNTVVGDVNLAENSALPSDMNNAVREIMSHQKEAFGSGTPLYVDQTNNRLGVGVTAPEQPFHVRSSTFAYMRSESTNATFTGLDVGQHQSGYGVINMRDNQDIRFYTNDAEKLRIQAAGGISFNGDSAANNALSDYEHGTFVPAFGTTQTGFSSVTYHTQTGRYVRVGDIVYTYWVISTSALTKGSAAGAIIITGFPYTMQNNNYQAGSVGYSQGWTTNHPTSLLGSPNQTQVFVYHSNGSTSHVNTNETNMSDHSSGTLHWVYGSLTYRVE